MAFEREKGAVANGAEHPPLDGGEEPLLATSEDPEVLITEAAKESTSSGITYALLQDPDVISATTSVSDSAPSDDEYSPGPDSGLGFLEADEDDEDDVASLYPTSSYPKVHAMHQVEYPYNPDHDDGLDNGTIDSSRTLYAEDVDFVFENGHWYCGDYYMPIDEDEKIRQYVVHNVYLQFFHGELTSVPLEDPKYILDVGTGIGEWAIGMAEKYPNCEVFGSDIAPIQETQVPSNVEFQIETAEDEWIRPADTVDLVHLRDTSAAFQDWSFIYEQAFKCIKPGGWIEISDLDDYEAFQNFVSFYPTNSPIHILVTGLREASALCRRRSGIAHLNHQLLIDAGFVDVKETMYTLLLGEHQNASYSTLWLTACITGIEPSCMRLLTKYLSWDASYVRRLCKVVVAETKRMANDPVRAAGFGVKLRVLTARKPTQPGQWTAQSLNENGEIASESDGGDGSTIGSRSVLTGTTGSTI